MKTFSLTLLVLLLSIIEARPQQVDGILPAPKSNLVAIHWPNLSSIEVEVSGHLLKEQSSLTAAVKTAGASDAKLSEAYGSMGQTFHAYSFNAPARECYVNASRLAPRDFRWVYLMAKLDQQDGRVDEAIKNYLSAQSLNPNYVAASINLGNIFLEANRLSEARQHFLAALKIDKESPAAHYGLGQVALSERNYAEAVRYFERTLAIVPAATRVHYSLAMAYRGLGTIEQAKTNLRLQGTVGVRVADPLVDQLQELVQGERLHLIRGRLALEAKRYAEAADEFRKAVAARPESVTGRVNLGAVLNLLGDQRGALEQFQAALRLAPENANAHYNLAVLLGGQNRHQEAITHLQSVLKSNPRDSGAQFLLAQAYLRSEQYKQALDSLEKSHAMFPEKTGITITLAKLLATSPSSDLRNGARALELAQRTYQATGLMEHAAVISLALAELGRCAEALEWQKKLIDAAERQEKVSVAEILKRDLQLYEGSPCRPR
jgi:tetratricopeptide (TPR) repeat protein